MAAAEGDDVSFAFQVGDSIHATNSSQVVSRAQSCTGPSCVEERFGFARMAECDSLALIGELELTPIGPPVQSRRRAV